MIKGRSFFALIYLCLLFCIDNAIAQTETTIESGYTKLDTLLNSLGTIQADFIQVVKDNRDQEIERSSGQLQIKRPGKFRWEYKKPNLQALVSDGQRLWIYDAELEQVTINRIDASLMGSPAMLLSGKDGLRANFEIEHVEQRTDLVLINLSPKVSASSDFKLIQVSIRGEQLVGMSLTDKLGQTTSLQFTQFKRNPKLSDSQFVFTPPKGVDLVDNTRPAGKVK